MKNSRWLSLTILCTATGQVGGALGLAILGTLAGRRTLELVRNGVDGGSALGYHLAWLVGAATVAITLVLAVSMLRPRNSSAAGVIATADSECAA